MKILILIVFLLIFFSFIIVLSTKVFSKSHTQYLNEQYLLSVKKAQKASLKNKATAEFWYAVSERYKSLLDAHNEFLKGQPK